MLKSLAVVLGYSVATVYKGAVFTVGAVLVARAMGVPV